MPTRIATDTYDQFIWTLDEADAPFANSGAGGSADLSKVNSPGVNQTGLFNKCVQISNGTTAYLKSAEGVAELAYPITVSLWFKPTSAVNGYLGCKNYNLGNTWTNPYVTFELYVYSNLTCEWDVVTATAQRHYQNPGYQCYLNAWNHIGLTYDGATCRYYLNGVITSSLALTGALDYGNHGSWFFGSSGAGGSGLTGYLDDIRIASTARAQSWFRDVYDAGHWEVGETFQTKPLFIPGTED